MNGIKGFLQSRTVWAAIIGFVATALQKSGYTVSGDDQQMVVNYSLDVVQMTSYLAAMYFRTRATKRVANPNDAL